jgi:hypothetical protein
VAYFWDGGEPVAHKVQNISSSGFYLSTKERWMVGTLIMMTLQRTSGISELPNHTIIVLSKVIRHAEDGVGFSFIPVEPVTPGKPTGPGASAADKRSLNKFLQILESDEGSASFGQVLFLAPLLLIPTHGIREAVLVLVSLVGLIFAAGPPLRAFNSFGGKNDSTPSSR